MEETSGGLPDGGKHSRGELLHLDEASPDDSGLGVGPVTQTIANSCPNRNYVLQRTRHFRTFHILNQSINREGEREREKCQQKRERQRERERERERREEEGAPTWTSATMKAGVWKSVLNTLAFSGTRYPMVASLSSPAPISPAMFAPMSTEQSIPSFLRTISEISCGPSGRILMPLVKLMAIASFLTWPWSLLQSWWANSCGQQNTMTFLRQVER